MGDTEEAPSKGKGLEDLSYEQKVALASPIANPMASRKLAKKLFKLVKKSSKQKFYLRRGLKAVQSKIRKDEKGIVIFAGNVSPIDVSCHLPILCEDRNIPYAYVPTGRDLGIAMGVKRATLVVLIREHESYKDLYDECYKEVKHLPPPVSQEQIFRGERAV